MTPHPATAGAVDVRVNGHLVTSVTARNEPERQKRHAREDLAAALPSPAALAADGVRLSAIATTPDFHPGKPVPVGVAVAADGGVLPHLIGNDIGCGMRMVVLDGIGPDDLGPDLDRHLRHLFFQGGRDIALDGRSRHAILRDGIPGLLESLERGRQGLLARLDLDAAWQDLERVSDIGRFECAAIDPDFADYAALDGGIRHDAILGSIGGGNHFVEFGIVERIEDGAMARAAAIGAGDVVLVVHSGSLDFGQRVGSIARARAQALKGRRADPRIVSADRDPEAFRRFVDGQANAANAAFANRMFIGLQAVEAVRRTIGRDVGQRLVYDAPHNVAWIEGTSALHRKGACSAKGPGDDLPGDYRWTGEPVILPGSMGDGTWLLTGTGNAPTLASAAHGAGRRLSRQEARRSGASIDRLRVIGPVDLHSQQIKGRRDLLEEAHGRLLEEAPAAYRPIDDVVDAMADAGMVRRAARIRPLLTVKG